MGRVCGVLHEHRVVGLWAVAMCHWRRWAVKTVCLRVVWGLGVDDARVEVRVLWVVCMQRRGAIGRGRGIDGHCVHGRDRTAASIGRRGSHAVSRGIVGGAGHGAAGNSRHRLRLVHGRLGVHVLWGADVSQLCVVCGLWEVARVGARVVADEVEVLAALGGDAEGLLHQTVGLVAVAVWALALGVARC